MPHSRFTRFGLLLSAAAWLALLVGIIAPATGFWPRYNDVASGLVTLGQSALASGLAIALLGGLRDGFAALDRFFAAVLARSVPPAKSVQQKAVVEPPQAANAARKRPALPPHSAPKIEEGFIGTRAFVLYADGVVEAETMLGHRRFESMAVARAFIGQSARSPAAAVDQAA